MNGNAPNDPTEEAKAASDSVPAAPAGAAPPPAAELDLEVEEIRRPPLMKEGFVGQER